MQYKALIPKYKSYPDAQIESTVIHSFVPFLIYFCCCKNPGGKKSIGPLIG